MHDQGDFVLGTAGHIDHGKTALVRALTGVETDRLPAEKQRGITIDLGFAALELGTCRLAIVDVPGHERFIRNMLAGATGFDLAMLVVAADDSVMPQTREHLQILRLLGLTTGLVVLTKCDLADPTWLDLVEDDVRALVADSFLQGAPIVRTSASTGLGIDDLKIALARLCDGIPIRNEPGLFRLAIDRSFTIAGHGTVVSGTVASGTLTVGEELEWLPAAKLVRARGLHRHDRPVEQLTRGARAAINLAGVHHSELVRGNEVAAPGYLAPSRVLSVEVRGMPDAVRPLRHRTRYRLHIGTAEVSATLAILERAAEATTDPMLAQLFLDKPVAAVHGEPFVLRSESPAATLGGGRVLQPLARRLRRSDTSCLTRFAQLRSADPIDRVAAALAGLGLEHWTERTICRDSGVPIGQVPLLLKSLIESGQMVEIPIGPRRSRRLLADVAADLEDRLLRALGRLHLESPRQSAIARSRVAAALAYLNDEPLVAGLIERLKAQGRLVSDARTAALKDHAPKLSQAERKLKTLIADAYKAGGLTPPEPSEWITGSTTKAGTVRELLQLLCEEESLAYIGPEFYLDFEVAADLRRKVAERLSDGSALTMAELRDLLGTTRKYAVPIGEYLDRVGLTRRDGDVRYLRQPAAASA
jgi:selenocysteine-specific elongation factor